MPGHYPDNILFFKNSFLYSSNSFSFHLITHFYSVILHTFSPYIFIHSRHFLSFVKGCSLAAESLFFTKIFNQRTLQLFTQYEPWLLFHF